MSSETETSTAAPETSMPDRGWRNQSLAELMEDQGIVGPQDVDSLLGSGADLWTDDEEFTEFLTWLRQTRHEGR